MGEWLTRRVRIEESYRALRGLQRQIAAWADRRHRQDVLDQYGAHVSVLKDFLLVILDDLAAALDGIDSGRPVGDVYTECRRADGRLGLVERLWVWFRAMFDQRDDPVFGPCSLPPTRLYGAATQESSTTRRPYPVDRSLAA